MDERHTYLQQDLESMLQRALKDQLQVQQLLDELRAQVPQVSAAASTLTTTTEHLSQAIEALRDLMPGATALLTSLQGSSRPRRLRAMIAAAALTLATTLATLLAITALHPGWSLRQEQRQQLELGALILERYPELSVQEQAQLERLLHRLSRLPAPSSATSPP
jgi:hypothetical protein